MLMTWNKTLETGIGWQDSQHKELYLKLGSMVEKMRDGGGREEMDKLLRFLSAYTVDHFSDEEKYMDMFNYERYFAHRMEHKEFKSKLFHIKRCFEAYDTHLMLVAELYHLLADWMRCHIDKSDKTLGAFLKDKVI